MQPRIIKSEAEYDAALARVDELMSATAGTPELDELKHWTMLVKAYENEHYPIDLPGPISAIKYYIEQQGLHRADLIPMIGSKSRVSEVLSGKRALSLAMIRKLHAGLGIPLEILIQESAPKTKKAKTKARTKNPSTSTSRSTSTIFRSSTSTSTKRPR